MPKGLKGTKPIPSSSRVGHHGFFRFAPEERILALQCGHRLHGVGAANGLRAGLRQPEVFDFAFRDQVLDRPCDIFDRNVQVDAMLIVKIDRIDLKTLERGLRNLLDVFRTAVEASI